MTLVTPPDIAAYRRWVFDQFCSQLRDGTEPVAWSGRVADVPEVRQDIVTSGGTITVDEDLDLEGSARVRDAIAQRLEEGVTDLRVDLARCEFVDSVGISLMLTTLARLRDSGGSLVLVERLRRRAPDVATRRNPRPARPRLTACSVARWTEGGC